ncbi:hypothetical protein ACTFIV_003232, partial [Dictyostelium citrinum]
TRCCAGGVTRRKENIRQYLEIQKGLTNVKVKSKYLNAVQGQYLLNECQVLGIQTIGCGDTTLNLPKITYPLIGNFKSREKRSALLLLMYHAMFEGMRQETSIFVEYYNKYTRINTEVRNLLKKKGMRETYEQKIMKTIYVIGISGLIFNKNNIINILIISELNLGTLGMLFVLASVELNDILGELSGLYILTFTAAESAIGLAIVVILYSKTGIINIRNLNKLKG